MQVKALTPLTHLDTGETVQIGGVLDVPDDRAERLIAQGHAEKVTATEAKQIAKQQDGASAP